MADHFAVLGKMVELSRMTRLFSCNSAPFMVSWSKAKLCVLSQNEPSDTQANKAEYGAYLGDQLIGIPVHNFNALTRNNPPLDFFGAVWVKKRNLILLDLLSFFGKRNSVGQTVHLKYVITDDFCNGFKQAVNRRFIPLFNVVIPVSVKKILTGEEEQSFRLTGM